MCVFVLAYCGLPRNIVSKFTNFLCIYVCVWWHATQPRSGRTKWIDLFGNILLSSSHICMLRCVRYPLLISGQTSSVCCCCNLRITYPYLWHTNCGPSQQHRCHRCCRRRCIASWPRRASRPSYANLLSLVSLTVCRRTMTRTGDTGQTPDDARHPHSERTRLVICRISSTFAYP